MGSLANMFYRCITLVEDAFGKTDVYTMHSDKKKRDNKGTKEFHKFKLGFDIVDSLPSEFDKLTEDLLLSITTYVYEPTKSFEEWTKEACTNACKKGHTVLFKEKIVPQLTQAKTYRNNSTGVLTEETRKEFFDLWKKQVVNEKEDNDRKEELVKVVEPMIVKDSTTFTISSFLSLSSFSFTTCFFHRSKNSFLASSVNTPVVLFLYVLACVS